MRKNLRHKIPFLVLTFGLISCNSDESVLQPQPEQSPRVGLQRPDKSYRYISDVEHMNIGESLHFELEENSLAQSHLEMQVDCQSNRFIGRNSQELTVQKVKNLPLAHILPAQVFTPLKPEEMKLSCDIRTKLFKDQQLKAKLLLQDTDILGIENFHNWQPDFLPAQTQEAFFHLEDFNNFELALPFENSEVSLLCEDRIQELHIQGPTLTMNRFNNNHLVHEKRLTPCRLVARSLQRPEQKISPRFWLQKERPTIDYHLETEQRAENTNDLNHSPLMRLHIYNPGSAPVQIHIGKQEIKMQFAWIFLAAIQTHVSEFSTLYHHPMRWQLERSDQNKILSENSEGYTLEIPENQQVTLNLTSTHRLMCATVAGLTRPGGTGQLCARTIRFGGFMYEPATPMHLQINQINDNKRFYWQDQNIKMGKTRKNGEPLKHRAIFVNSPCLNPNESWTHNLRPGGLNVTNLCSFQ